MESSCTNQPSGRSTEKWQRKREKQYNIGENKILGGYESNIRSNL
jgi:hypothetical protein